MRMTDIALEPYVEAKTIEAVYKVKQMTLWCCHCLLPVATWYRMSNPRAVLIMVLQDYAKSCCHIEPDINAWCDRLLPSHRCSSGQEANDHLSYHKRGAEMTWLMQR